MPSPSPFEWWPDPDIGPFRIFVHTEMLRGRLEVVGITITSAQESSLPPLLETEPDGQSPGASEPTKLTSDVLRGPLGAVIARLRSRIIEQGGQERPEEPDSADEIALSIEMPTVELLVDGDAGLAEEARSVPSHARIPQALIAQAYKEAHALSSSPTRAVAERFGITYHSAASRIMRARKAGLLPPTQRGSAASTDPREET